MSFTHGSNISSALYAFLQPVVSLPREHLVAIQNIINDAVALQSDAARPPLTRSYDNIQRHEVLWFKPRMDLFESLAEAGTQPLMTATFELPGLRKEDVHIDVLDNRMIVVGHRQHLPNSATSSTSASGPGVAQDGGMGRVEGAATVDTHVVSGTDEKRRDKSMPPGCCPELRERYTIREIKRGRFKRVVPLPVGTKLEDVKASMHDGILTVTFPGSVRPVAHSVPVS